MCWHDLLPKFPPPPSPSSKMPNTCAIFKWTVFNSMWTKWMTKKILCTCLLLFIHGRFDFFFFWLNWKPTQKSHTAIYWQIELTLRTIITDTRIITLSDRGLYWSQRTDVQDVQGNTLICYSFVWKNYSWKLYNFPSKVLFVVVAETVETCITLCS